MYNKREIPIENYKQIEIEGKIPFIGWIKKINPNPNPNPNTKS